MVVALQYRTDLLEIHRFTRFESSLAHLGFRHFQPLASLRPWVHRYFHLQVATNLPQSIEQTFYPDGGTTYSSISQHQALIQTPMNLK